MLLINPKTHVNRIFTTMTIDMLDSVTLCTYTLFITMHHINFVPVSEHPGTLVLPQVHEHRLRVDNGVDRADHAQPDAAEVAQVEDVVELGRGRQHLGLRFQPQLASEGYQSLSQGTDL